MQKAQGSNQNKDHPTRTVADDILRNMYFRLPTNARHVTKLWNHQQYGCENLKTRDLQICTRAKTILNVVTIYQVSL